MGHPGSVKRFLNKSWPEKVRSLKFSALKTFGFFPCRLPSGLWWIASNDWVGMGILAGTFESAEWRFTESFIQPGMAVLDIGAHHGLYTLLAARKVGPRGKVISFEPSPRERRKLLLNVRLNRLRNVQVLDCALGSREGDADFFVVDGMDAACNSLRPPNVAGPTRVVRVPLKTLDHCLSAGEAEHADFIKMDVEGGEWEALKGAAGLLHRRPRPVILCEVQEIRTRSWGYQAKEIVGFLREREFSWFGFTPDGSLALLDPQQETFDGNFVAVPVERLSELFASTKERRASSSRELVSRT